MTPERGYQLHLSRGDFVLKNVEGQTTEIQFALGLVQLKKLDRNNSRRKKLVEIYQKELQETREISIFFSRFKGTPSYHLFPILVTPFVDRNRMMERLKHLGIQSSIHYPPVHLFSLYRNQFGYRKGDLPITEEVSRRELTLPLHPVMKEEDVRQIARTVKKATRGSIRESD